MQSKSQSAMEMNISIFKILLSLFFVFSFFGHEWNNMTQNTNTTTTMNAPPEEVVEPNPGGQITDGKTYQLKLKYHT